MNKHPQLISRYQQRLELAQQIASYDELDDKTKALIAQLAYDTDLSQLDFNEILNEELAACRRNIGKAAVVQAAEAPVVMVELTHSMPTTFEEARGMTGCSIEEVLRRSDTSINDPDDIDFMMSGVQKHMIDLHKFSDQYREAYGKGNSAAEKKLADENNMIWVQHNSLQFLREDGRNPDKYPTVRIYLNPKLQDSLKIYKDIFVEASRMKLRFQAKIIDPSAYRDDLVDRVASHKSEIAKSGHLESRRDPILFYGFDESKDELLRIVEEVYKKYQDSFEGRETGSIPLPIAPGLAIGENPVGMDGEESLTSHRDSVIEMAKRDPAEFRRIARAHHINPDNIAFNH
jgi:hypothetical protein